MEEIPVQKNLGELSVRNWFYERLHLMTIICNICLVLIFNLKSKLFFNILLLIFCYCTCNCSWYMHLTMCMAFEYHTKNCLHYRNVLINHSWYAYFDMPQQPLQEQYWMWLLSVLYGFDQWSNQNTKDVVCKCLLYLNFFTKNVYKCYIRMYFDVLIIQHSPCSLVNIGKVKNSITQGFQTFLTHDPHV